MTLQELPHWARRKANHISTLAYDAWIGATKPEAMPSGQRRLDAFKLFAGVTATAFCLATENPLITAATSIPAVESVHDFAAAGEAWVKAHPGARPSVHL